MCLYRLCGICRLVDSMDMSATTEKIYHNYMHDGDGYVYRIVNEGYTFVMVL